MYEVHGILFKMGVKSFNYRELMGILVTIHEIINISKKYFHQIRSACIRFLRVIGDSSAAFFLVCIFAEFPKGLPCFKPASIMTH